MPFFERSSFNFRVILKIAMFDYEGNSTKENQCKVAISSELIIAVPPWKEKISYILESVLHEKDCPCNI